MSWPSCLYHRHLLSPPHPPFHLSISPSLTLSVSLPWSLSLSLTLSLSPFLRSYYARNDPISDLI